MRVLVPLNTMDHLDDYINAGTGEFYIGFYDEEWFDTFGDYADINRLTGFRKSANLYNFEEVLNIIDVVKQKGKMIYITFNASIYSEAQIAFVKKYFIRLSKTKVDGVIVSCAELVKLGVEVGVPVVISTIAGVYNQNIARYYYELGAKRIILPRDLMLDEIESIVKAVPEAEYEVFMMRNGCPFSDSNCLGFHRSEKPSICATMHQAGSDLLQENPTFHNQHDMELNDMVYRNSFHTYACGLCSIYRFVKLNITAGKIVGRMDEWENICRDIEYVDKNVQIAKECHSEKEYLEKMLMPDARAIMCKLGFSCYYPEVRY